MMKNVKCGNGFIDSATGYLDIRTMTDWCSVTCYYKLTDGQVVIQSDMFVESLQPVKY
jgi:hypothetical protein